MLRKGLTLVFLISDAALGVAAEIRDVKPPMDFPTNYFFLFFILLLIIGICCFLVIQALLIKLKGKKKKTEESRVDPYSMALKKLEELKKETLPLQGKVNLYYTKLSDIVRCYMEGRFKIRAPEMTTEEFLWTLNQKNIFKENQKQLLKEFLNGCDLVKFADYQATLKEIDQSLLQAERLIEETKEIS